MKLQELAVANPTKQAAKVFENYFGDRVSFDSMSQQQARGMLKRVRALIAEHRRTAEFHRSEQNPAYLKLVVMEQALASQATAPNSAVAPANSQQASTAMAQERQQRQRDIDEAIKIKQKELADLQKQKSMSESQWNLRTRLREASEVQQAQVVLASQDMVDQVQKMSEQVSAMQFKDLPALIDSIKNEVGVDQATQFNADASAALSGLLQNLQGAKQQLEAAVGVVTGQAPQVPGADMTGGPVAEIPAELPALDGEEEVDLDLDVDAEEPAAAGLGRERR
jgi:hypothetical protein